MKTRVARSGMSFKLLSVPIGPPSPVATDSNPFAFNPVPYEIPQCSKCIQTGRLVESNNAFLLRELWGTDSGL